MPGHLQGKALKDGEAPQDEGVIWRDLEGVPEEDIPKTIHDCSEVQLANTLRTMVTAEGTISGGKPFV